MEFINTLTDPTVIASTLISIVIYLISPVFDRFRNTIILFASKMPSVVRSALRRQKAKTLKKIKQQRQNGDLVTFESAKSHAYLVLFFGSLAAFWWLMILGALEGFNKGPAIIQVIVGLPIFIFEALWLLQNAKAKTLVSYRNKIRVTSQSTSRLRRRTR